MNSKEYTAFFCEENIWHVVNGLNINKLKCCNVLFLTNENKSIALANQKAAKGKSHIIWDYHTILHDLEKSSIYDFDSTLGFETEIRKYFEYTFGEQHLLYNEFRTKVIPIPARNYKNEFTSDRTHMLDKNGNPLLPFPEWPQISQNGELNIKKLMNLESTVTEKFGCMSSDDYLIDFI